MVEIIERLREKRKEIKAARLADKEAKKDLLENASTARSAMDNEKSVYSAILKE